MESCRNLTFRGKTRGSFLVADTAFILRHVRHEFNFYMGSAKELIEPSYSVGALDVPVPVRCLSSEQFVGQGLGIL